LTVAYKTARHYGIAGLSYFAGTQEPAAPLFVAVDIVDAAEAHSLMARLPKANPLSKTTTDTRKLRIHSFCSPLQVS